MRYVGILFIIYGCLFILQMVIPGPHAFGWDYEDVITLTSLHTIVIYLGYLLLLRREVGVEGSLICFLQGGALVGVALLTRVSTQSISPEKEILMAILGCISFVVGGALRYSQIRKKASKEDDGP